MLTAIISKTGNVFMSKTNKTESDISKSKLHRIVVCQEPRRSKKIRYSTGMDQTHRDLIRKNYVPLSSALTTAIDDVCTKLWSEGVISDVMKENILVKNTSRKKAEALLDLIVTRGPHAFEALYKSSVAAEVFIAADILHPETQPHG